MKSNPKALFQYFDFISEPGQAVPTVPITQQRTTFNRSSEESCISYFPIHKPIQKKEISKVQPTREATFRCNSNEIFTFPPPIPNLCTTKKSKSPRESGKISNCSFLSSTIGVLPVRTGNVIFCPATVSEWFDDVFIIPTEESFAEQEDNNSLFHLPLP